jgi:hypothetical protein
MNWNFKLFTLFMLTCLSQIVTAHGGGLDGQGGHNDRKNGEYHCHKSPCEAEGAAVKKPESKYNRDHGRIGQI